MEDVTKEGLLEYAAWCKVGNFMAGLSPAGRVAQNFVVFHTDTVGIQYDEFLKCAEVAESLAYEGGS